MNSEATAAFIAYSPPLRYADTSPLLNHSFTSGWKEDLDGSCFPSDSLPDPYPLANRNTAFFLESATLLYRQTLALPASPPLTRPRMYGNNSKWLGRTAAFTSLPCVLAATQNAGYFGAPGVWDAKGFFEHAAFGYTSCGSTARVPPFDDIAQSVAAARYFGGGAPRFLDGRRALHLLRRLWTCADAHNGSYASCEHSAAQTELLASKVAAMDMTSFLTVQGGYKVALASPISWLCGANPTNNGVCSFDLNTEVQVGYFSLWFDVLSSREGLVSPQNLTLVAAGLRARIDLFRSQFNSGDWRLWNGNNWTPRLSTGAMQWVIAFWHEESVVALDVLQMINDALWLHYPFFYLADGTAVRPPVPLTFSEFWH